ncbi:MAG: OsmC family protein [Thermomicrobiales bacterium]|nr:OsmC family protein [Thermomicrobiales bacterium]
MSGLREYLVDKKAAVAAARQQVEQENSAPRRIEATVRAEGRSGVRRTQIRGHEFLTDSSRELGGFDLGPSPVETLLGALGGCLAHTIIIQAATRDIPLDALEVSVGAVSDPGTNQPRDITYQVRITSPENQEKVERLVAAAESVCPITSLLVNPQRVSGSVVVATPTGDAILATANGRAS